MMLFLCGRNYPLLHEWVFFFNNGEGTEHSIWACYFDYLLHKTKINPLKLIVTDVQTNFVQDLYHQHCFGVTMKQFSQSYMKQVMILFIMYNIVDNLKYSVTFTLNVYRFGSMRKQNMEEPLPWLRTTCGVGLIADITVFGQIVCSFEIHNRLVTQSFHTYYDGVCRTQFFCYICALDVGRVKNLQFFDDLLRTWSI